MNNTFNFFVFKFVLPDTFYRNNLKWRVLVLSENDELVFTELILLNGNS